MTVREELVHAGARTPKTDPSPALASWAGTSNEELRAIMSRGPLAGDLFFAASAEIERRARESDAAIHAEEERTEIRRQRLLWMMAGLFAAATAVLVLRLMALL